jgi:hypothetical protein
METFTNEELCDFLESVCDELHNRYKNPWGRPNIFSEALAKKITRCVLNHTKHLDVVGVQILDFNVCNWGGDIGMRHHIEVRSGWLRRNDFTEFIFEMIDAMEAYGHLEDEFIDHPLGGWDLDFNGANLLLKRFIKWSGEVMLWNNLDMARKWFKRFGYRIPKRLTMTTGEQALEWLEHCDERDGTDWVGAVKEQLHKVLNHNHIVETYGSTYDPEWLHEDFNSEMVDANTVLGLGEAGRIGMHVRGVFTLNRGEAALDAIPVTPVNWGGYHFRDDPLGR